MLRLVSIIFLLTLDLAFAEHNSTSLDGLKDGSDAVYTFYNIENIIRKSGIDCIVEKYDVHFRKSVDPNKVVVFFKNVDITGKGDDYINKLSLPIIVGHDDKVYIIPTDTSKSVNQKLVAYGMLTELSKWKSGAGYVPDPTKFVKNGKSDYFQNCAKKFRVEEVDGKVRIRVKTKRSQCYDLRIVERYSKYGATNFDESVEVSDMEYDKVTGKFLGAFTQLQGTLNNSEKDSVRSSDNFTFVGYQEIQEVFDETKNVPQDKPV